MSRDTNLVLYTIPFSHYCETARWSLQEKGIAFTERSYLPGLHMMLSPVARFRGEAGEAPNSRNLHNVPLLYDSARSGGGVVGSDSWQCLRYGEDGHVRDRDRDHSPPSKDDTEMEKKVQDLLDKEIGPCGRSIIYSYLLHPSGSGEAMFQRMCDGCREVGWFQRRLFPFVRPKVTSVMHRHMVKNDEHVAKLRDRLESALAFMDERLSKEDDEFRQIFERNGTITAMGIAFASLLYPLVFPNELIPVVYRDDVVLDIHDDTLVPVGLRDDILRWRGTLSGKLCLELYKKYRLISKSGTSD